MKTNGRAKAVITAVAALVLADWWRDWRGLKRIAEFFTQPKEKHGDAA